MAEVRGDEPLYIGSPERPWFVWQHRPAGQAGDTALVIVPPFGHEAISAHRALRHLAQRAASAGVTAYRVDLDGTGDSAGDDLDPDRVNAWLASILGAVDAARASGATRVVLAGVRLGAALAVQAASRADVAGVIAIVPVVAGRKWLREMRALQQAVGLPPTPPGRVVDDGIDEALGFAISAATKEELSALDLEKATVKPATHVLVIDRDDMPGSDKWVAKLRALGSEVDHQKLPGYAAMMLDADEAEVPEQMLAAALAWLRGLPAPPTATPAPARRTFAKSARFGDVIEEPITIDGRLSAIVSRPAEGKPRRALVILNAGCVRRIGPNRMFVTVARRCAAEGTLVVRADLGGIGDSPAHTGHPERVVYPPTAEADVAAVLAWCRKEGIDRVVLAGLCSGAVFTLETALAGADLAGFIVINPGNREAANALAAEDAARYRTAVRDVAKWKKLISGGVDMKRLFQVVKKRGAAVVSKRVRDVARKVGFPLRGDLGVELQRLAKKGVKPAFFFCADEPGLVVFREKGGELVGRLVNEGAVAMTLLEGADHTLTPRWSQAVLADEVAGALRRIA
jgi:dienelactone hydrolase